MADTESPTPIGADDLLTQNAPPPSPFKQPSQVAAPNKPKFVSDGKQWVEQVTDGSGREPKTEPFSAQDYIGQLPLDLQGLGGKLLNYSIPYPTQQLARETLKGGGPWTQVLKAVSKDPTFDATKYDARRQANIDFSSGSQGKPGANITSLNTAIGHLDNYKDAAAKLGNYNIPVIGGLVNGAINSAEAKSDPRVVRLTNAQQALSEELTRAFRGSSGSVSDVDAWKNNLNRDSGERVQQAAADSAVELMATRIRNLRQQYLDTVGRAPSFQFLRPDSRRILQKLGYDPDAVESGTYGAAGGIGTTAPQSAPTSNRHIIAIGGKNYQYNGSGATDDMKNYTAVKP